MDMRSYPIYRLPEVHFANRDRYEQTGERQQGWRASKLVLYAHAENEPHVAVGFYVEKGTGVDAFGPIDRALWDWPRFLELLRAPARRRIVEEIVTRHDLTIGDYVGGRFGPEGALVKFVAQNVDSELVVRHDDGREQRGWPALTEAVEALPEGDWHDLHIWRQWPASGAIAAGHSFAAQDLLPVMLDLASVYELVISPGRS